MPTPRRATRGAPARNRPVPKAAPAAVPLAATADPPRDARLWSRIALTAIGLYAAFLLFVIVGPHRVGDYFTETDFYGAYAEGARALQRGVLDPARYGVVGPFYEIALAVVGLVVRDLFLAAELLSLVAMTAGLLLWHRILTRRADARLALGAVLLLVVNATFLRYGYSATTDGLAFGLQAAALALLLLPGGTRLALAAGVVAALAFLTRYSAVVLLPAGLAAILAGGTRYERRGHAALLFAAGFLLPVAPWIAWSLARGGGGVATQLHHNVAYDVFARSRGIPWDEYQRTMQPEFRSLWDVVRRDPAAVARRELFNVWDHLRLDAVQLVGLPVAICAAIGALAIALDGTLRRTWPLWVFALLLFLSLVPAFYSERYGLPLLPAWAALAAAAFASPRFGLAAGRRRLSLLPLLIVPIALTLPATRRQLSRALEQLPVEVLESARTLRELRRPGDRVIARKPHLAFHAGVSAQAFPFTRTLPELAEYARRSGARWLFFSWPEAEMRPQYAFLLDTAGAIPGLTVRHAVQGRPAVLYEIGPGFGQVPRWEPARLQWHRARGALMVNPRDTQALYVLAYVEANRGELASARRRLDLAARLKPRDARALLLLGEVNLNLEDGPGAASAFARAAAAEPGNPQAQVGLGWASLLQRRPDEAARRWRPVIGATRDPATLQRMIDVFGALGDAAAERDARAALARLRGS